MALNNPLFVLSRPHQFQEVLRVSRFYARHSQSETVEGDGDQRYVAHLYEAVDANWFDEYQGELGANLAFYNEAKLALLEVRVRMQEKPLFDIFIQEDGARAAPWVEIFPGARGGALPLHAFANLAGEGVIGSVEKILPVNEYQAKRLERTVNLDHLPDASEADLRMVLDPLGVRRLTHAVAFDVGQGNAIGCFDDEGWLRFYFDLGGGAGSHAFTFPRNLRGFCFTENPPVILSHWDHDHWSSAYRAPRSLEQTWIAPRQDMGLIQAALAAQLVATGRLLLVPTGFPGARFGQLYLERCTGAGRNNGGLALTFSDPDGHEGEMLFPGDAQYQFIPSCPAGKTYHSMVALHHGATPSAKRVPGCTARNTSRLVYSYGPGNTYRHASDDARHSHHGVGWHDIRINPAVTPLVRNTELRTSAGLGHVWLGWRAPAKPHAMHCCDRYCQLAATQ